MSDAPALKLVPPSSALPVKRPWFKFFPSDWRGDECLATCSLAARGLLIELVALMHVAEPRGFLLVNGVAPTDAELSRLIRATSIAETRRLLRELLTHRVLSTTADDIVYSRRMVKETAQSAIGHETGKRGGNPRLKPLRVRVNPSPLTQPLTVTPKPSDAQMLRCTPLPPPAGGAEAAACETEHTEEALSDLWNETTTPPLPRVRELTPKRRRHIRARLKERPLNEWRDVIERIERSDFCRGLVAPSGGRSQSWRASFDWLIGSPDSAVKVLEGAYANHDAHGGLHGNDYDETQQFLDQFREGQLP